MRKCLMALLLSAILLFGVACAEDFTATIATAELDELIRMRQEIDNEIMTRFGKIDGIMIEPGMYIVGEDIPAGNYYFEGVKGRYPTSIHVYPSLDKTRTLDATQSVSGIGYSEYDTKASPKSGKFILRDGDVVEFVQGPAIIHLFLGLMN